MNRLTYENIKDIYRLSPMQEGMYFHYLLNNSSTAYFEQVSLRIQGKLQIDLVKESINEIFKRYDILRTVFNHEKKNVPLQIVLKEQSPDFYFEDISNSFLPEEKIEFIKTYKENERRKTFNLTEDVLTRIAIFQIDKNEYEFIWSFHHILTDGWGIHILLSEFFEIYSSLFEKTEYHLPPVKQYSEYIKWLGHQDKNKSKIYWENYLADYQEATHIPKRTDNNCSLDKYRDGMSELLLDERKSTALNEIAGKNEVTLNMLVRAVWALILGRLNNTGDTVFGAVVSGRPPDIEGIESIVGLFINTIPVRIKYDDGIKFSEMLQLVKHEDQESKPHNYFPLAEIQANSLLKQNLLDHILVFENYPMSGRINDLFSMHKKSELKLLHSDAFEQTNYDLNISIIPGNQLKILWIYNLNVFNIEDINRISSIIDYTISQIIANDRIKINEIEILTEIEKHRILYEFNNTVTAYPGHKSIPELFEESCEEIPNHISVSFKDENITYGELNKKANQLAWILRASGINRDSIVGVLQERSIDIIVSILGILKAGGGYLPIDPEYPEKKIISIINDSLPPILLTTFDFINRYPFINLQFNKKADENKLSGKGPMKKRTREREVLFVDELNDVLTKQPGQNIRTINQPSDLAYIMYTSGSTGNAKGVMVKHKNVTRLVKNNDFVEFSPGIRILQTGAISFDATIFEIWGSFLNKGLLVLAELQVILDPAILRKTLIKYNINTIWFTSPLFNQLMQQDSDMFNTLKYMIVGGDILSPHYINMVRRKNKSLKVVNGYGPTENTTFSTCYSINKDFKKNIPIGKPIKNSFAYILDTKGRLQPILVAGELCVSGDGVARGYLNSPELTAKKFVLDPFANGKQMYKTGDICRWLPDGNIDFMGRGDQQVKIRGFRIELEEIENMIKQHKEIKDAVVLLSTKTEKSDQTGSTDSRNKYLCAYIVSDTEFISGDLREFLSRVFPDYMIPSYFMQIDKIPLNPNGKINRKALPHFEISLREGDYAAPQNKTEEILVEIWSEVLNLDRKTIGRNSNFFELGGHSINVMTMLAKLKSKDMYAVVSDVFTSPSLKNFAECITGKNSDKTGLIAKIGEAEKVLKEKFCADSAFLKYYADEDSYMVLFIEDTLLDRYEDILQFFRNYSQKEIAPHFIRPLSQKPGTANEEISLDKKQFTELFQLKKCGDISALCDKMLSCIEKESLKFNETFVNNQVIKQYKVSPIQKASLSLECFLSGTVMTFEQSDIEFLNEAFLNVIKLQGLLRSTLIKKDGDLLWKEMSPPDQIAIPCIDLSEYDLEVKEPLINGIIHRINLTFESHQYESSLPYKVLLFKKDLKTHLLAISLDHSIFDAMSREILEKQILNYYRLKKSKKEVALEKVKPYSEYIKQISQGPQKINVNEMIEIFDLNEYYESQKKINNIIKEKEIGEIKFSDIEIKFSENMNEEKVWELSCELFCVILKRYFGLSKIPIKVISYGRKYQGNSYFDTVGEFLDLIPILVNTEEASTAKILGNIHEKIELASEHNINFMSLMFDEGLKGKWRNVADLIIPGQLKLTDSTIVFNFPGKIPGDEIEHMIAQIKQAVKNKKINKISDFLFQTLYSSNSLHINIFSTFEIDTTELKELLGGEK